MILQPSSGQGPAVVHIPTGITMTSTSGRSQLANKRDVMNKLNAIDIL